MKINVIMLFITKSTTQTRRGLSLMEVLFAIGVLMVGLLGIAALLPVGTHNAAGALRTDATAAAIENQFSNAISRLGGVPNEFDFPVPSLRAFNPNSPPGFRSGLSAETYGWQAGQYFVRLPKNVVPAVPPTVPAVMPSVDPATGISLSAVAPAFCIDPAFLAAADNLRNDTNDNPGNRALNYYDRTKFPCFDFNYHPARAPGMQMSLPGAWPVTPRMFRVTLNPNEAAPVPSSEVSRILLSERDGFPLNKPADTTRPPSRFFRMMADGTAAFGPDAQRSGAFSSIVTLTPVNRTATSYEASVVVYEARQLTTNLLGLDVADPNDVFRLAPFPNNPPWPAQATSPPSTRTYGEEVMGVVTQSDGPIVGGIGRFRFVHSVACNPDVKVGQWLMLARRDAPAGIDRYGWYRITEILAAPDLATFDDQPVFVTEVEVRGADWIFHPAMVSPTGAIGPHPNLETMPAARAQATIVVKAPKVVAVRTMTL